MNNPINWSFSPYAHQSSSSSLSFSDGNRLQEILLLLTINTTSFPGFSPTRLTAVGRVGENPGSEVAINTESRHSRLPETEQLSES